jgi:peptidoglycan L-alanyl-D-glutamate endopeptidase CwlK
MVSAPPLTVKYRFSMASLASRAKLHPKLIACVDLAIREMDFKILDATRGRAAQERAFALGHSKARFGDSAHNYLPAVAVDLFPAPYSWDTKRADVRDAFKQLADVMMHAGQRLGVPLRWGGDWDRDGRPNSVGLIDLPHFELHPWRSFVDPSMLVKD